MGLPSKWRGRAYRLPFRTRAPWPVGVTRFTPYAKGLIQEGMTTIRDEASCMYFNEDRDAHSHAAVLRRPP